MDMWVGARSAWHSKSLERRSSTYVSGRTGCYFTKAFTHAVQSEATCIYLNRDAATKKNEES